MWEWLLNLFNFGGDTGGMPDIAVPTVDTGTATSIADMAPDAAGTSAGGIPDIAAPSVGGAFPSGDVVASQIPGLTQGMGANPSTAAAGALSGALNQATATPTPPTTAGVAASGTAGPEGAAPFLQDPGTAATQAQADLSAGMGGNAQPYGGTTPYGAPEPTGQGWQQTLKGIAGDVKTGAQLGAPVLMGASMLQGAHNAKTANKTAQEANTLRMQAAQPAVDYAKAVLPAAAAGQLTQGQEASLQVARQQLTARVNQMLANTGGLQSSSAVDWAGWVDAQIEKMRSDMLNETARTAIGASQVGSNAAPAGTNPETYQQALTAAQQTLGQLATVS